MRQPWTGVVPRLRTLLLAMALVGGSVGCAREPEPTPIPIGATERDVVVRSSPLARDLTMSAVGMRRTGEKKNDRAADWSYSFEERRDAPSDHVVRRRFRLTLSNRSEQAMELGAEIDYVATSGGELLKARKLGTIVVPPFTETQVSGYTPLREDRVARADARVWEVKRTE